MKNKQTKYTSSVPKGLTLAVVGPASIGNEYTGEAIFKPISNSTEVRNLALHLVSRYEIHSELLGWLQAVERQLSYEVKIKAISEGSGSGGMLPKLREIISKAEYLS